MIRCIFVMFTLSISPQHSIAGAAGREMVYKFGVLWR